MAIRVVSFIILLFAFFGQQSCAQVPGCTDPLANNYNSSATVNDGSCTYNPATITPTTPLVLSDTLAETSGLIWWNSMLWTHNDNTDSNLYVIDTATGAISQTIAIPAVNNQDWEEITQDGDYIYVGDFGNNVNGNRQNLHILRIAKAGLGTSTTVDTIWFSYSDQTSFAPTGSNNTDYDCEAFIATADSLYLFSKQWVSKRTALYAVPKTPGTYTAQLRDTFDVQGMITGAAYLPARRTIVLSGYELNGFMLPPFAYLLYDFNNYDFFKGNKRRININQAIAQVEGIATANGTSFFITNEQIINSLATLPPRLQKIDLTPYLKQYYQTHAGSFKALTNESVTVYPNPASGMIALRIAAAMSQSIQLALHDTNGSKVWEQQRKVVKGDNRLALELPELANGVYWLNISGDKAAVRKKILYNRL